MLHAVEGKGKFIVGDPSKGITRWTLDEIKKEHPENIKFVLVKRSNSSPTKKFGWHWFTPLLKSTNYHYFLSLYHLYWHRYLDWQYRS